MMCIETSKSHRIRSNPGQPPRIQSMWDHRTAYGLIAIGSTLNVPIYRACRRVLIPCKGRNAMSAESQRSPIERRRMALRPTCASSTFQMPRSLTVTTRAGHMICHNLLNAEECRFAIRRQARFCRCGCIPRHAILRRFDNLRSRSGKSCDIIGVAGGRKNRSGRAFSLSAQIL